MKRILSAVLVLVMLVGMVPNLVDKAEAGADVMPITSSGGVLNIGDTITLGTYLGEPIVWRCVDIDENGPLMLSEKILCFKAFDAKGTDNKYHSDGWGYIRNNYGSNCWSDSNLRQWLNSYDYKVEWTHCSPSKDRVYNGYNPYENESGFLTNFTQAELLQIKTVTQKNYINEWETHREGYWDGGSRELIYWPSENNVSYDSYYYQNVTDKIFLLNPGQIDAVYRYSKEYLLNAYPTQAAINNSTFTHEKMSTDLPWEYWLGVPRNEGASYENQTISSTIGGESIVTYTGCYAGYYGVRPAFYYDVYANMPIGTDPTPFDLRTDGYAFRNNYDGFSYDTIGLTKIKYDSYQAVYGDEIKQLYDSSSLTWGGNCFGMAITSVLFNEGILPLSKYMDIGQYVENATLNTGILSGIRNSSEGKKYFYTNLNSDIANLIEQYQIWQDSKSWHELNKNAVYEARNSKNGDDSGAVAPLLFRQYENYHVAIKCSLGGHSVVIDSSRLPEYRGDGWFCLYFYDPNNPYSAFFEDSTSNDMKPESYYNSATSREILINIKTNEWRTNICGVAVGFDDYGNYIPGSEIRFRRYNYDTLPTSFDGTEEWYYGENSANTANICSNNASVYDTNGALALQITDGQVTYSSDDITITTDTGLLEGEIIPAYTLELPYDDFTIEFGSEGTAQVFNEGNCYGFVADTGSTANIKADDSVVVGGTEGSTVDVVVENLYEDDTFTSVNLVVENDGTNDTSIVLNDDNTLDVQNASDTFDVQVMSDGWENELKITDTSSADIENTDIVEYVSANGEIVPNDINDARIDFITSFIYNGTEKTIEPIVTYCGKSLTLGTDYTISGDVSGTEIGSYTVVIEGIGKYTGTTEIEYRILPQVRFKGASLTLQNDLSINFKVDADSVDSNDYFNPYVKFTLDGEEFIVSDYELIDDSYVFTLDSISPDRMADSITATVYAINGGVVCEGQTVTYSIAEYCYNMLSQCTGDEHAALRTLLVDLLNYGAASQNYTGHSTDSLANANLTDEQAVYGTSNAPELESVLDLEYATIDNPTVKWKSAGLNLNNSICMRFKIAADSIENLTVKITGAGKEWSIPSSDFEAIDGGYYFYFNGYGVAQMSEPVYLTVYDGDTAVSNTLRYSIQSYAYSMQDSEDTALSELVVAMMKYGNAAKAYVDQSRYHVQYNPSPGVSGDSSAIVNDYNFNENYTFPSNYFDRVYTDNHGNPTHYHILGWSQSDHQQSPALPASEAAKLINYFSGDPFSNLQNDTGTTNLWAVMTPGVIQIENKSSGYGWETALDNYLWYEHPVGTDSLFNTIGGNGNTVFRYKYDQTFDIAYAKYLVFDLNMLDDSTGYGENFKKLISYSTGQIELSSGGQADVNEHSVLWNVVWDNSYYIDNGDGWHQIWVPLSIFNGDADLSKINFFGMYWNSTSSTVRVQMTNPTFRYEMPTTAKDIR